MGAKASLSAMCLLWAAAAAAAAAAPSSAQDLVYQPVNPSFGGNPFNSDHLLGLATAQNKYTDPAAARANATQANNFAQQLQSRLLSALSSQVVEAIFGENPQEQGTIKFGGQTVEFFRSLDEVTLTITDDATGGITTIVIPTFITAN